ncbi:MAG: type II/IV secretion system ATPase subunit [Candidatus Aenigmatarchaeota archaeon]
MLREKLKARGSEPLEEKIGSFTVREPKHLLVIPEFDDIEEVDIQYPLLQSFAYANIRWSDLQNELIYRVVEPELTEREEEIYEELTESLVELVDVKLSTVKTDSQATDYLEKKIKQIVKELDIELSKSQFSKIMYYIYRNFVGLNKIEPLMHDPYIEDIGCDGIGTPLYMIHKKFGSMQTNIVYEEEDELKEFIVKLAERCGRYVSYAEPLLDGSLPDGSRVQATYSEDVSTKGPNFSIRKFTEEPFSPTELIDLGTANAELLAYLWLCIENGVSLLICGGVASGKTSFLNAISLFIPEQDKIVSIEDTRELNLPHENWIPSQIRSGFGMSSEDEENYGEVDMYDLLRASFRQNPDYVIVGEVRGDEAYVMFQGMSSGHPAISTMHAGGVDTVIKRLQSPPIELPPTLVETLDLVVNMIHAKGVSESARRAKSLVEITSVDKDTGEPNENEVFSWAPSEDRFDFRDQADYVLTKIAREKGLEIDDIRKEIKTREALLKWMYENGVMDWKDVARTISEYLRSPEETLDERGIDRDVYVSPPSSLKSETVVTREPGGLDEENKSSGKEDGESSSE